jgi:hypothetical protein
MGLSLLALLLIPLGLTLAMSFRGVLAPTLVPIRRNNRHARRELAIKMPQPRS